MQMNGRYPAGERRLCAKATGGNGSESGIAQWLPCQRDFPSLKATAGVCDALRARAPAVDSLRPGATASGRYRGGNTYHVHFGVIRRRVRARGRDPQAGQDPEARPVVVRRKRRPDRFWTTTLSPKFPDFALRVGDSTLSPEGQRIPSC